MIDLSDERCNELEMICTTQNVTSLEWFFDDIQIASYTYSATQMLPFTVPNILDEEDGVIHIIESVPLSLNSDRFNATSVLTTTTLALSKLKVGNVQCGIRSARSELRGLNVRGKFGVHEWEGGEIV